MKIRYRGKNQVNQGNGISSTSQRIYRIHEYAYHTTTVAHGSHAISKPTKPYDTSFHIYRQPHTLSKIRIAEAAPTAINIRFTMID